jgi:general secretion pathway protein A
MYRKFYGFSEDPFNLTPDPSFLFNPPGYGDVLSSIEFGIKERKGIMVITGEVGTGKTTLINALLKELSERIKTAFIFNPKLSFKQLLKTLLWELKIPVTGASTSSLRGRLNEFLKERMAEDENVLIVIDEAQNLSPRVLDDLNRLYQQVPSGVNTLQILLVGQLELETKLNSEELRRFKERVTIQKQINLLTTQESRQYIDHRLKVVGSSSSKVFTPEAVEAICEYAKGVPRVINLICDGALFVGYEASAPVIDVQMVRKAIAENEITIEEEPLSKEEVILGMKMVAEGVPIEKKEASAEEWIIPREEEALGEQPDLLPRQEGEARRERPLYQKVGIPAFVLACVAVFALLFWPENRVQPLKEKEEDRTLPLDQRPIEQEQEEEKSIKVEGGLTLSIITKRFYGSTNPALIDLILDANPQIIDLNRIQVGDSIKIPKVREKLLLIKAADHAFKIHLGTFADREQVRTFRDEPVLQGKNFEMIARKVSPRETWYRLVAGPFATEEEALQSIQALKQRGLLPFFPGARIES